MEAILADKQTAQWVDSARLCDVERFEAAEGVNGRNHLKGASLWCDHLRSQAQVILDQSCRNILNLLLPTLPPNRPTEVQMITESLS